MKNTVRFLFLCILLIPFGKNKAALSPEPKDLRPRFWAKEFLPLQVRYHQLLQQFDDEDYDPLEDALLEWESVIPEVTFFDFSDSPDFAGKTIDVFGFSLRPLESPDRILLAHTQLKTADFGDYLLITQASIAFNTDYRFNLAPPLRRLFGKHHNFRIYDLPSVFLHEVGHLLGLHHTCLDDDIPCNSVMKPLRGPLERNREVLDDDVNALRNLYEQRDSFLGERTLTSTDKQAIIVEEQQALYANEDCIHRKNGRVVYTHKVSF